MIQQFTKLENLEAARGTPIEIWNEFNKSSTKQKCTSLSQRTNEPFIGQKGEQNEWLIKLKKYFFSWYITPPILFVFKMTFDYVRVVQCKFYVYRKQLLVKFWDP